MRAHRRLHIADGPRITHAIDVVKQMANFVLRQVQMQVLERTSQFFLLHQQATIAPPRHAVSAKPRGNMRHHETTLYHGAQGPNASKAERTRRTAPSWSMSNTSNTSARSRTCTEGHRQTVAAMSHMHKPFFQVCCSTIHSPGCAQRSHGSCGGVHAQLVFHGGVDWLLLRQQWQQH